MLKLRLVLAALLFCSPAIMLSAQQTVQIHVDLNQADGPLKPVWAYVRHDEPNYTYSIKGGALLEQLGKLSSYVFHDRTHNLLTTGNGTPALKWGSTNAYTEDSAGKPVYSWKTIDRIFDTYKSTGITPYAEIVFMPEALSIHPRPYRDTWPNGPLFTGWSYPPQSYSKWSELPPASVLGKLSRRNATLRPDSNDDRPSVAACHPRITLKEAEKNGWAPYECRLFSYPNL